MPHPDKKSKNRQENSSNPVYTVHMNRDTERLLPILVYIQTHLEEELSLETPATRAALSPFHFHRLFRGTIGETLKQYIQRLRLERAAYQLKIHKASIIDIAFGLGYHSHETFSRAFRRPRLSTQPDRYLCSRGRAIENLRFFD